MLSLPLMGVATIGFYDLYILLKFNPSSNPNCVQAVRVEHCERIQLIVPTARITIANCRECVFYLGVNQRPLFTGDNHNLQVQLNLEHFCLSRSISVIGWVFSQTGCSNLQVQFMHSKKLFVGLMYENLAPF